MKKTRKTAVKKVTKTAVKKVVGSTTANKVVLTLKQAQTIEGVLAKLGKTNKVLSNKIAAITA